jgi:RNA polymerase sigma factor (sigma-70 family)
MISDTNPDGAEFPPCDPTRLLTEHERWLRTVLLARSGEPCAVSELFQEVAMAVLRHPPTHIPAARRAAWLYGVAVRTAVMYRRTAGRRRRLHNRLAAVTAPQGAPDPLHWLLAHERQQLVRQALDELGPKDREVLLLKYTEDWSYVEIADHLGMSISAVEARLHRARCRLRAALAARHVVEVNV